MQLLQGLEVKRRKWPLQFNNSKKVCSWILRTDNIRMCYYYRQAENNGSIFFCSCSTSI